MKKILNYYLLFCSVAFPGCDNDDVQTHQMTYIVPNSTGINWPEYVFSTYQYPSGETNLNAYTFQPEGHYQRDYTYNDGKIYILRDGRIDVVNASTLVSETSKEVNVPDGYDYNRIVVTDTKIYLLGYASGATALHRFSKTSLEDEGAFVASNVPEVIDAIATGDKLVIGSTNLYIIDAVSGEVTGSIDVPANVNFLLNGTDNNIIVVHPAQVSTVDLQSGSVATFDDFSQTDLRPALDVEGNTLLYLQTAAQPFPYRYSGIYEMDLETGSVSELVEYGAWLDDIDITGFGYDTHHQTLLIAGPRYSDTGILKIMDRKGNVAKEVEGFNNPTGILIHSN